MIDYNNMKFTLRAHTIIWTGDIPAITKVLNLTGHNSYMACWFCNIWGIYNYHIYYPLNSSLQSSSYDLINLPMRSHKEYNNDITKINQIYSESDKNKQINLRGWFL